MKVKFVDFERQYVPLREEIDSAIKKVVDSYYFVNGPALKEFETNFANYIGTKYCAGVGSGTDALVVALKALGVGPGDEVIIPDLTYIATMSAVKLVGAAPIIVPCDAFTFCMDGVGLEGFITTNTKAIIYVHLYGSAGYFEDVKKVCDKHNLFLIEDAAQAAGAEYKDNKCGSLGDIGCFSFYPAKNLGCFGQGGAITTNHDYVYDFVKEYANCGMENAETVGGLKVGINSRLDDIQAAVLNVNLKYLDKWNTYRNIVADFYHDTVIKDLGIQYIPEECYSSYHLFVMNVFPEEPEDIIEYLGKHGIEARQHYAFTMSGVEYNIPSTYSMVSLPMSPYITLLDVQHIGDVLEEWGKNGY